MLEVGGRGMSGHSAPMLEKSAILIDRLASNGAQCFQTKNWAAPQILSEWAFSKIHNAPILSEWAFI